VPSVTAAATALPADRLELGGPGIVSALVHLLLLGFWIEGVRRAGDRRAVEEP